MIALNKAYPGATGNSQDPWLSATAFADLAGISDWAARKALARALEGRIWREIRLEVRKVKAGGGPKGQRYEVRVASLPPEFQDRFRSDRNQPLLTSEPTHTALSTVDSSLPVAVPAVVTDALPPVLRPTVIMDDRAAWRLALIQPIRHGSAPGSAERAAMIRAVAEQELTDRTGRRVTISERSLRDWITSYEADGIAGLGRQCRKDRGQRRVNIGRAWDAALKEAGASDEQMAQTVDGIRNDVASLWRSGTPSWPNVQLLAKPFVTERTKAIGVSVPDEVLRAISVLPRAVIEAGRAHSLVAVKEKDAKKYKDKFIPRVRRDRSHLKPMEWIAGDVRHCDVAFTREDGSICTPKMVAFLDLATNRLFYRIFLKSKGEMIRREDVIEVFVAMCEDPSWGAPTSLYVDNGGEYNWGEFVSDLCKLKRSITLRDWQDVEGDAGMRKAKPYNAPAKVIETIFSILTRSLEPMMPGFIGGDRMKKKVETEGRPPKPYPGDFKALVNSYLNLIGFYHNKPQSGHLKGKSPNQRFAEFIVDGWKSITLDRTELAVAFSKADARTVLTGGEFTFAGTRYRHNILVGLVGGKIIVRQPLFGDRAQLFVYSEDDEPLCTAQPPEVFKFGDIEGAKEQGRRTGALNRAVAALKDDSEVIDLEQAMARANAAAGPAPVGESDGVIRVRKFQPPTEAATAAPAKPALDKAAIRRQMVANLRSA